MMKRKIIKILEERVSKIEALLSDFPDLIGIFKEIETLILGMPYIKEASDKLRAEMEKSQNLSQKSHEN